MKLRTPVRKMPDVSLVLTLLALRVLLLESCTHRHTDAQARRHTRTHTQTHTDTHRHTHAHRRTH